jgi:xanthine dehydrogenase accessory factor
MLGENEDVLGKALDWFDEGRTVALATVIETWGSSPRPRGAQLAVREDGLFVGSVSGGCVEGRVVEAAQLAMQDKATRLLEFGVSNDEAWEVGLACGGTVRIHVEPVTERDVLAAVRAARVADERIVLVLPLDGGATRIAPPGEHATDEARIVGSVFVLPQNPLLRLVVVGAVHIAMPLVRMATLLGYATSVIDPREAFAHAERWPGIDVSTDYPDEVLASRPLTRRSALVALTHDPKIDDPALEVALKSDAFYIGALGSTKTHAARLARLAERGFSAEVLRRIHGPVGLRIGARSPAEIAVAIAAQMTEALRT